MLKSATRKIVTIAVVFLAGAALSLATTPAAQAGGFGITFGGGVSAMVHMAVRVKPKAKGLDMAAGSLNRRTAIVGALHSLTGSMDVPLRQADFPRGVEAYTSLSAQLTEGGIGDEHVMLP